ncbi:nuclear transport factor 2 family protein [Actinokineospora globicatena]|uniref:nuclear transport factor 2 family protein n=1 Tax=Actinokineospora globicatena TaxID=103729 RepID=UPI0025533C75|nr:nuclear transport factor 2 family protein [Actinokineospora globicatena]
MRRTVYVTTDNALAADSATALQELVDRQEIVDTLHRFAFGRDLGDRALFESAFTADAEFDFRPAATKCGLEVPLFEGIEMIAGIVLDPRLHTTHSVTNTRVSVDGDTASLSAIVEAQHLPAADHSRHALLKNLYAATLVRDGKRWRIKHVTIDNVWYTGDPQVIVGG